MQIHSHECSSFLVHQNMHQHAVSMIQFHASLLHVSLHYIHKFFRNSFKCRVVSGTPSHSIMQKATWNPQTTLQLQWYLTICVCNYTHLQRYQLPSAGSTSYPAGPCSFECAPEVSQVQPILSHENKHLKTALHGHKYYGASTVTTV